MLLAIPLLLIPVVLYNIVVLFGAPSEAGMVQADVLLPKNARGRGAVQLFHVRCARNNSCMARVRHLPLLPYMSIRLRVFQSACRKLRVVV